MNKKSILVGLFVMALSLTSCSKLIENENSMKTKADVSENEELTEADLSQIDDISDLKNDQELLDKFEDVIFDARVKARELERKLDESDDSTEKKQLEEKIEKLNKLIEKGNDLIDQVEEEK